jgi:hypothetical protein
MGLRSEKGCAGDARQKLKSTDPTVSGPFSLTFHPLEKANATADCLENQFTPHDLRDKNHQRQVEARV